MADWLATSTRVPRKVALHGVSNGTADPLSPVSACAEAGDLRARGGQLDELVGEPGEGDVHVTGPADPEAVGQVTGSRGPQRLQRARARRWPSTGSR